MLLGEKIEQHDSMREETKAKILERVAEIREEEQLKSQEQEKTQDKHKDWDLSF